MKTFCENHYGYHNNIFEAKEACIIDQNCSGLSDDDCDNNGVSLCPSPSVEGTGEPTSCIYIKQGNVLCTDYDFSMVIF